MSEPTAKGNFVSEWFGHRVYPLIAKGTGPLTDQHSGRCPLLSEATGTVRECIKPAASKGICTISSSSNGPRQDWLVCPHRALDQPLLGRVARLLFVVHESQKVTVIPAPALGNAAVQEELIQSLEAGEAVVVYLQDKLGGEISVSATDRSPEFSFDITLVELVLRGDNCTLGKYGILEVQTMDFHGSYRAVVNNLQDALRLHGDGFHDALSQNPRWLSEKIEGPNIANVFKRTFYQIAVKFQIGADESCAGCVLAIPVSVWDSWQRHLARPELRPREDGTFLLAGDEEQRAERVPAWIYVFEIDATSPSSPNPITVQRVIGTDAEAVSYHALQVAPQVAVSGAGSTDRVRLSIRHRLRQWWPTLGTGIVAAS